VGGQTDASVPAADETADVVVIGSGIGGLCCGALLARYGLDVVVCESHYLPGGCAHTFSKDGYQFDVGPSFHAGLSQQKGETTSPLKQVLDALDEPLDCVTYDRWVVHSPEGAWDCVANAEAYRNSIRGIAGEKAVAEWDALVRRMEPLSNGAGMLPAAALRMDLGAAITVGKALAAGGNLGPGFARTGLLASTLTGPFSDVVKREVTNTRLKNLLDLECFVLSGCLADDTICAEMAYMFAERNKAGSTIDYPMGGGKSIIDALVRGLEKNGGKLRLQAHVEKVLVEAGQAAGVTLRAQGRRPAQTIRARKAVISNATVWDTLKLLPEGAVQESWRRDRAKAPMNESFLHMHLGIDATGLPSDLECHHLIVNDWNNLRAPQNVVVASIPTVFDPSLAPPNKHAIHVYSAGNEPYSVWEGLKRGSPEYNELKEERSQCLIKGLERIIPDVQERIELKMVGTPLTHEFFNRRHRGTYGAAYSAGRGEAFPGPATPLKGLYMCGDSTAPGIGVPAAAASGMICANTLVPVKQHLELLKAVGLA